MTFTEAMKYALKLREDVSVMLDPILHEYHVIRSFGVEHWKKHYKLISTIKMVPKITGRGAK